MGYNVLIADDCPNDRSMVEELLKKTLSNVTFFTAEKGNQVIDFISNQDIDLVILDLLIHENDGLEVLREIKSHNLYKQIPVIVSSTPEKIENIQTALELGAIDCFIKPMTVDKIIMPLKVKNGLKLCDQSKLLHRLYQEMKNELSVAQFLQKNLMTEYKLFKQVEVYGCYIPCNEIGGDFYDAIQLDEEFWFIIADVTGHGIASAMATSMLKVLFGESIRKYRSPKQALEYLNRMFSSMTQERNIIVLSAFIGMICNNKLRFANAGHPYPVIVRRRQRIIEYLEEDGYLIGAFDNASYKNCQVSLEPGDTILAFTDGLFFNRTHALCTNWNQEGNFLLHEIDLIEQNPLLYIHTAIQNFRELQSNDLEDDMTLMLIKTKKV